MSDLIRKENNKNVRNYEKGMNLLTKIGNNKIICGNKFFVGNKYYHIFISLILLILPTSIFISILVKINTKLSIFFLVLMIIFFTPIIIFLFFGGCTDPGILERNNEYAYYDNRKSVLKLNIQGHMINLNYCYTCFHFRPPRTSHCAECDNCVQNFDHHCLWMGTCVGKRNYRYFYFVIFFTTICSLIQFFCSIGYIINHFKYTEDKFKSSESKYLVISLSFVSFFNLMFLIFFLAKLFYLHTRLLSKGLTFYEYIRNKYFVTLKIIPYSRGFFSNIYKKIFKKIPLSRLNLEKLNKENWEIIETNKQITENKIRNQNKNEHNDTGGINNSNNENNENSKTNNNIEYFYNDNIDINGVNNDQNNSNNNNINNNNNSNSNINNNKLNKENKEKNNSGLIDNSYNNIKKDSHINENKNDNENEDKNEYNKDIDNDKDNIEINTDEEIENNIKSKNVNEDDNLKDKEIKINKKDNLNDKNDIEIVKSNKMKSIKIKKIKVASIHQINKKSKIIRETSQKENNESTKKEITEDPIKLNSSDKGKTNLIDDSNQNNINK